MNKLTQNNISNISTITTMEIAKMMNVPHYKILEKLVGTKDCKTKGIIPVMNAHEIVVVDYFLISTYVDAKGEVRPCYLVTKMGCDFLANKFTGEKGILFTAQYVKRFSEMEQTLSHPKLPTNYKEALQHLLLEVQENERLQDKLTELKPKADFHDAISATKSCITFGNFSGIIQNNKDIKIGRNKLMNWCREKGYLCSSHDLKNKPSQQMIKNRYMKYNETINIHNEDAPITYTPLITGIGQIWLTKKIMENKENLK